MSGEIRKLYAFTEKKFPECEFLIYGKHPFIYVELKRGRFDALSKGSGKCLIRASKGPAEARNLDPSIVSPVISSQQLTYYVTKVFQEIVKFIRDELYSPKSLPNSVLFYEFEVSLDYTNTDRGSIAKPTKIEHKTAKRPRRRSVTEAILGRSTAKDNAKIVGEIKVFLKQKFGSCKFLVEEGVEGRLFCVSIKLIGGDFEPYIEKRPGKNFVDCYLSSTKSGSGHYKSVAEIDPKYVDVSSGFRDYYTLTPESQIVFKKIVKHISLNYNGFSNLFFGFSISGVNNYKDTSALPGSISKPTEIEHKTFKGRKRRSVAEAILGGYFCDC